VSDKHRATAAGANEQGGAVRGGYASRLLDDSLRRSRTDARDRLRGMRTARRPRVGGPLRANVGSAASARRIASNDARMTLQNEREKVRRLTPTLALRLLDRTTSRRHPLYLLCLPCPLSQAVPARGDGWKWASQIVARAQ
jgi:hypothetical protein